MARDTRTVRESTVEKYLHLKARRNKGDTRKVKWIGRAHSPDRRVMLPGWCFWAETKRPDAEARKGQVREHQRMREYGEEVHVLDSKALIDLLFETKGYRE